MSLDGKYILHYDTQNYISPTPMELDINFLKEKYGGEVVRITEFDWLWVKSKYTLPAEDGRKLLADQILESCGGDNWHPIRGAV